MGRKETHFTPKELKKRDWLPAYALISINYFKVANHFRALARTEHEHLSGHCFIFPSLTMYVAAFEAFMQEHLASSLAQVVNSESNDRAALVDLLETLKSQSPPYQDFKEWIKEIYRRYDRNGVGIDPNSSEYQNLIALKELRNAVIHYNPVFIQNIAWPVRLEQALHKTKLGVISPDWVTHFSRVEVADWAHDSIKAAVQLFCRLGGVVDTFSVTLEQNGVPPWE